MLPGCVGEKEKDKGKRDPEKVSQKLQGLGNEGPWETLGLRDKALETWVSLLCHTRTTVCLGPRGRGSRLRVASGPASAGLKRQCSLFKILERRAGVHVSFLWGHDKSLGKLGVVLKFCWWGE